MKWLSLDQIFQPSWLLCRKKTCWIPRLHLCESFVLLQQQQMDLFMRFLEDLLGTQKINLKKSRFKNFLKKQDFLLILLDYVLWEHVKLREHFILQKHMSMHWNFLKMKWKFCRNGVEYLMGLNKILNVRI